MSFPNIIYGDYGDERNTYSTKPESIELERLMILPDGKKFRFGKASATAMVAGNLYQQNTLGVVAGTADADMLNALATVSGGVAGSSTIVVTLAGTAALSKNLLVGGTLFFVSGSAQGQSYKIKSNTVAGSVSACTITIEGTFKTTIAAATTLVGLRQNRYDNLTITTANTAGVGALAGVPPVPIPASNWGWIQRSGLCNVLVDATTPVISQPVIASTTVAGAIGKHEVVVAAGTTGVTYPGKSLRPVGHVVNIAASASYALIDLMLE